jgi:putative SOS response-associated peptidase YedK
MCGRLSLTSADHRSAAILIAGMIPRFDQAAVGEWLERNSYRARYNVAPGQPHWIVRGHQGRPILARAEWGMLGGNGKLVINARAETVGSRPLFHDAFARSRCLVVADGFFEWDRKASRSQPWWFRGSSGRGLLFAAVLSDDKFAVVTVPANPDVRELHDRMPAIIAPADYAKWLFESAANAKPLLEPMPAGGLVATRVSRRINSAEHDDPACVEAETIEPARQRALFE